MDELPNEVVEIILSSPRLTFEDVLNFGATSKHFYMVVHQSSYIWKKKYQQHWPQFLKLFDACFNNWYSEILYLHDLSNRTHALLSTMSPRFYKESELSASDFEDWLIIMNETPQSYHYIILDLINILSDCTPIKSIHVVPVNTAGNKTFQYYAQKALRFLRQRFLAKIWNEFQQLPLEEQLLEKGAIFVAQWCQPALNIEIEDITSQLDNIAKEVIMDVMCQYPNHPLTKVTEEILLKWKLYNLDANQWTITECRQILQSITTVLYKHHNFSGNNIAYYMPENSYINEVLARKQGLPITLAVIFESIARRVGIKCEPYSFPSHFLLKFTEGKGNTIGESYYIDVFNHGNIIRKGCCPRNSQAGFMQNPHKGLQPATAQEVVERMGNNIELSCRQYAPPRANYTALLRAALELLHVINQQDLQTVIGLARLYMMHGIDTKPLENLLTSGNFISDVPEQVTGVVNMLHDYDLHRKHNYSEPLTQTPEYVIRPKDLIYAVGMVMKHVGLNYHCVIYDWDPNCRAALKWQKQIGVQKYRYGRHQPFYKILAEDGSHCYSPQEHLTPIEPRELNFKLEEIGKHFSHFFETHYVPNAEKDQDYPFDAEVRHRFYQQIQFGA